MLPKDMKPKSNAVSNREIDTLLSSMSTIQGDFPIIDVPIQHRRVWNFGERPLAKMDVSQRDVKASTVPDLSPNTDTPDSTIKQKQRLLKPQHGTLAPTDGTVSPNGGTLAPSDKTPSPSDGTLPLNDGTLAPSDGTVPRDLITSAILPTRLSINAALTTDLMGLDVLRSLGHKKIVDARLDTELALDNAGISQVMKSSTRRRYQGNVPLGFPLDRKRVSVVASVDLPTYISKMHATDNTRPRFDVKIPDPGKRKESIGVTMKLQPDPVDQSSNFDTPIKESLGTVIRYDVPDLSPNTDTPESTINQKQRLSRPQHGTLAPTDGTLSPNDGTLAPSDKTPSPSDGTLPLSDGTLTPSDGTVPRDLLTSAIIPTRLSVNAALTTDLMDLDVLRSLGHKKIVDARLDTELALDNAGISQVMKSITRRRYQGNVPLGFPFDGKRVSVVASVNLPTYISKMHATENTRPRFDVKIPDPGKRKESIGVTMKLQSDPVDQSSNFDTPIKESRGTIIRYDAPDLSPNTDTPDSTIKQKQRLSKPQHGTPAPTDGTLFPNNGILAPSDKTPSPSDGTLPLNDGTLAPSDGTVPRDLLSSAILPTRLSINAALTTDLMGLDVLRSLGHKKIVDARLDTELALDNAGISQVMKSSTRRRYQGNVPLGFPLDGKRVSVVASVDLPTYISKMHATENIRPRFDVKIPDPGKRKESIGVTMKLQPDAVDQSSNFDTPIKESRGTIIRYDVPKRKKIDTKAIEKGVRSTTALAETIGLLDTPQTTKVSATRPVIHATLDSSIYKPNIKYDRKPPANEYRNNAEKGLDITTYDFHTTPSFEVQPSEQVATVMYGKKKKDSKKIFTTKVPEDFKLDVPMKPELQDKAPPDTMDAVKITKYITDSNVHSQTPQYQRPKESIKATSLSYDVPTITTNIGDVSDTIGTTRSAISHIKTKDVENIQPNFYDKRGRSPYVQNAKLSEIFSVNKPLIIPTTPKPTTIARVSKRLRYKYLQAEAKKILEIMRARIEDSKRIQHIKSDKRSPSPSVQSVRPTRQNVGTRKPSFDVPRPHASRRTGQSTGTRKPSFDTPRPAAASRRKTSSRRRQHTTKRQADTIQSSRRRGTNRKTPFIGPPRSPPPPRSGRADSSRSSVPRQRRPERKPRPTDPNAHMTRDSPVTVAKPPSSRSRKSHPTSRSSRTKQKGTKHRVKTITRRRKPAPTSRTTLLRKKSPITMTKAPVSRSRVSADRATTPIRKRKPIPTVKASSPRRRGSDPTARRTSPTSRKTDRRIPPSSSRRGSGLPPQPSRRWGPEQRTTFDVQRSPNDPWHQPIPNQAAADAFPQDPVYRRDPWDFAVDMFSQPFPGSFDTFFPGAFGFMGPPLFNGPLEDQWPGYQPAPIFGAAPVDQGWGYPRHDPRPIEPRADRPPNRARQPPSRKIESTRQRSPSGQRAGKRRPADATRRPTPSVNKKDGRSPPNKFDRPQSRKRLSASRSRNTRPPTNSGRSRQRQSSGRQQDQHSRKKFEQNRADFPLSNQWSPFPYTGVSDWYKPPPPTQDAHMPFYEPPFAYSDISYGSQPYLPQDYHYPGEPYSPWQSAPRPYQDWPMQHRPQPPSNKYPLPMYDGASPYSQRLGSQLSPLMLHLMDADVMPMFGGGSMIDF